MIVLDIDVKGYGKPSKLILDGKAVAKIPAHIAKGNHEIELVMDNTPSR